MPSRRTKKQYCECCNVEIKMKNGKYNKRFCTKVCSDNHSIGDKHASWRGGQYTSNGYVYIRDTSHPNCYKNGYVRRCRIVVEKSIGRHLKEEENVHHINEIKDDDRIENLKVLSSSEHLSLHMSKPRPERRIREHYITRPSKVIEGKHIHIGKEYRHVVGTECIVCRKKYWARFVSNSKHCSALCHWVTRKAVKK